jgi:mannose/fructose/N-acetylgalactosamine-specific phosphotransferase system component IID
MKNIGNFLIGTLSSLGVSASLPDTAKAASEVSGTLVDSIEALISLLSGILSAILVAWLKRKWDKKTKGI